jgi:amidase
VDSLETATIADLQAAMERGELTSRALVELYLSRVTAIDRSGPCLRSVIEVNPEARAIAAQLDAERRARGPRGPLHGIPVLVKDNIDTADRMQTTAGSLALVGEPPAEDATVVARLRAAGAVILGKANLSEWANFRSTRSSSGWSARGGQTRNPHVLDRSPGGSSSGSGVAVAAALCAAALGTETNGSIVSPANCNGVVGLKPTLGLTSRAGVVPIAHSQDCVGPLARCVADAAIVLSAIAGADDPRDPATAAAAGHVAADYTRFLARDGLRGVRIGIPRQVYFGYSEKADRVAEEAIAALRAAGAEIVDPADIPTATAIRDDGPEVLLYEFKADLNAYLATRRGVPVRSLAELIAFNEAHAAEEMPFFGQELLLQAEAKGPLTDPAYLAALERSRRLAGRDGIDAVMDAHRLDALMAPTGAPAWTIDQVNGDRVRGGSSSPTAKAGYPIISVPAGWSHGLPVNVSFMGRPWSEPLLLRIAYAFEQATQAFRVPRYLPTVTA